MRGGVGVTKPTAGHTMETFCQLFLYNRTPNCSFAVITKRPSMQYLPEPRMRKFPTQEEALDVLQRFFPVFIAAVKEGMEASNWRVTQDLTAQHSVHQPVFRAWDMYKYTLNAFKRRLSEVPELRMEIGTQSYSIICDEMVEIWVKMIDANLETKNNHTKSSKARLCNQEIPGLALPTLILGFRTNVTATALEDLQLICRGGDGKIIWNIDVQRNILGATTIPFEPVPEPVTPAVERIMEIREELKKKKKQGNDGGTSE